MERPPESESRREKLIEHVEAWYEDTLKWWLETKKRRQLAIWGPIVLTGLTFIFLSPRLVGG